MAYVERGPDGRGAAVDGDDTAWVFNFGATKVGIGGPPPLPRRSRRR
jgi:hypothetical protein